MIELFPNISEEFRERVKLAADLAFLQKFPAEFLNEFTNLCASEEERDYCEFYFNLRVERMLNER